jgi:hypothetical protein
MPHSMLALLDASMQELPSSSDEGEDSVDAGSEEDVGEVNGSVDAGSEEDGSEEDGGEDAGGVEDGGEEDGGEEDGSEEDGSEDAGGMVNDGDGVIDELRALTVPWIVMAAGCCISWVIVTGCVATTTGWVL